MGTRGDPVLKKEKIKVLFICSQNAGRSQMAEGYLNARYGNRYDARSGGFHTSPINPITVRVMAEIGIDIGTHHSKTYREFSDETFDYMVILTDYAQKNEHKLPESTICVYRTFSDPWSDTGNVDELLAGFRVVREEITEWIDRFFGQGLDR